jgi:hypothetical protein
MISLLEDVKNSLQGPKATGNSLDYDVTRDIPLRYLKKLAAKMQMIAQSVFTHRASLYPELTTRRLLRLIWRLSQSS